MKKRSGQVAMRHAKAVLEREFPVIQYAGKRVVRLSASRMIAQSEDLLNGCFDALGVAFGRILAVQVTSQTASRSSVANRKRKIEREFLKHFDRRDPRPLGVEVWAWVNREGFRVWTWEPASEAWIEADEMTLSPLLKSSPRSP